MRHFFSFLTVILLSLPAHSSGYIGTGYSFNSSASIDNQSNGLRIDWGATATKNLDLEWSLVDFGTSSYDHPTYINAADSEDDKDNYEDLGFGSLKREGDNIAYRGTDSLHAKGASAGLKFKIDANDWLQLYARASLLVWQTKTQTIELSQSREAIFEQDDEGVDTTVISNLNACGNLTQCQTDGKSVNAVDFWYGYGFIAKPLDWLAIRAEYSIVTLNAVDFPRVTIEGFNTGLEIHF
jgi:opacity protein-like surface antigen